MRTSDSASKRGKVLNRGVSRSLGTRARSPPARRLVSVLATEKRPIRLGTAPDLDLMSARRQGRAERDELPQRALQTAELDHGLVVDPNPPLVATAGSTQPQRQLEMRWLGGDSAAASARSSLVGRSSSCSGRTQCSARGARRAGSVPALSGPSGSAVGRRE